MDSEPGLEQSVRGLDHPEAPVRPTASVAAGLRHHDRAAQARALAVVRAGRKVLGRRERPGGDRTVTG